jgi:hypothetical protein
MITTAMKLNIRRNGVTEAYPLYTADDLAASPKKICFCGNGQVYGLPLAEVSSNPQNVVPLCSRFGSDVIAHRPAFHVTLSALVMSVPFPPFGTRHNSVVSEIAFTDAYTGEPVSLSVPVKFTVRVNLTDGSFTMTTTAQAGESTAPGKSDSYMYGKNSSVTSMTADILINDTVIYTTTNLSHSVAIDQVLVPEASWF